MNKDKLNYSWMYRNSLSVVFIVLFIATLFMQAYTGWKVHNEELVKGGLSALSLAEYARSGHFISATFENFESEFLQMGLYVILTIRLRQIGSSESKSLGGEEAVDREPVAKPSAPWPVRRGGWILAVYKRSLSIAFILLFVISLGMHFYGSFHDFNTSRLIDDLPTVGVWEFITQADFWFEMFQNWQSEFLSVASIVILTIFLRQKGSPESKPVDAPNLETGSN